MDVASLVDRDGGKEGEGGSENENIAEKRRKGRRWPWRTEKDATQKTAMPPCRQRDEASGERHLSLRGILEL